MIKYWQLKMKKIITSVPFFKIILYIFLGIKDIKIKLKEALNQEFPKNKVFQIEEIYEKMVLIKNEMKLCLKIEVIKKKDFAKCKSNKMQQFDS